MPTLLDKIRAAVVGTAREFWPKVIATQAQAGAWDLCEALTALRELEEPTPCGAPPRTRWRLPPRRPFRRRSTASAVPSCVNRSTER